MAQCQLGLEEIHPQSGGLFLQASKEGGLGRAPVLPWSPIIENEEDVKTTG